MNLQLAIHSHVKFNTEWIIITSHACESECIAFMWYPLYPMIPDMLEIGIKYTVFSLRSMECIIVAVIDG